MIFESKNRFSLFNKNTQKTTPNNKTKHQTKNKKTIITKHENKGYFDEQLFIFVDIFLVVEFTFRLAGDFEIVFLFAFVVLLFFF